MVTEREILKKRNKQEKLGYTPKQTRAKRNNNRINNI